MAYSLVLANGQAFHRREEKSKFVRIQILTAPEKAWRKIPVYANIFGGAQIMALTLAKLWNHGCGAEIFSRDCKKLLEF